MEEKQPCQHRRGNGSLYVARSACVLICAVDTIKAFAGKIVAKNALESKIKNAMGTDIKITGYF